MTLKLKGRRVALLGVCAKAVETLKRIASFSRPARTRFASLANFLLSSFFFLGSLIFFAFFSPPRCLIRVLSLGGYVAILLRRMLCTVLTRQCPVVYPFLTEEWFEPDGDGSDISLMGTFYLARSN